MNLVEMFLEFYRLLKSGEYTWSEMILLISKILAGIADLLPDINLAACEMTEEECMARLAELDADVSTTSEAEPNFDPSIWVPIILRLIELWLKNRASS